MFVYHMVYVFSEKIFADLVPRCEETDCEGIVKPGIVMSVDNISKKFRQ